MSEVSLAGFVNGPFSMLAIPELLDGNDAHAVLLVRQDDFGSEDGKRQVKLEHGGRGTWL